MTFWRNKEAIRIRKEQDKSMNQDKGSYQLPHIYDKLFDAATFSDIQKSFTGKQQQISK